MKLYAFQPDGHGKYSFFIVAGNEQEARDKITDWVKSELQREPSLDYELKTWLDDNAYYHMTVAEPGQVITNSNE